MPTALDFARNAKRTENTGDVDDVSPKSDETETLKNSFNSNSGGFRLPENTLLDRFEMGASEQPPAHIRPNRSRRSSGIKSGSGSRARSRKNSLPSLQITPQRAPSAPSSSATSPAQSMRESNRDQENSRKRSDSTVSESTMNDSISSLRSCESGWTDSTRATSVAEEEDEQEIPIPLKSIDLENKDFAGTNVRPAFSAPHPNSASIAIMNDGNGTPELLEIPVLQQQPLSALSDKKRRLVDAQSTPVHKRTLELVTEGDKIPGAMLPFTSTIENIQPGNNGLRPSMEHSDGNQRSMAGRKEKSFGDMRTFDFQVPKALLYGNSNQAPAPQLRHARSQTFNGHRIISEEDKDSMRSSARSPELIRENSASRLKYVKQLTSPNTQLRQEPKSPKLAQK